MKEFLQRGTKSEVIGWVKLYPFMEAEREQAGLRTLRRSLWHIIFQINLLRKLIFSAMNVLITRTSYYSSNYFPLNEIHLVMG